MCATSTSRILLSVVTALALCGCGGFQRHAQEELSPGLVWRMVSPEKSELLWQGRMLASGDIRLSFVDTKVVGYVWVASGPGWPRRENDFCLDLRTKRLSVPPSPEDLAKDARTSFCASAAMGYHVPISCRVAFLEEIRLLGERLKHAEGTEACVEAVPSGRAADGGQPVCVSSASTYWLSDRDLRAHMTNAVRKASAASAFRLYRYFFFSRQYKPDAFLWLRIAGRCGDTNAVTIWRQWVERSVINENNFWRTNDFLESRAKYPSLVFYVNYEDALRHAPKKVAELQATLRACKFADALCRSGSKSTSHTVKTNGRQGAP